MLSGSWPKSRQQTNAVKAGSKSILYEEKRKLLSIKILFVGI